MKIVIMLGAPGSGKGTVSGRLVAADSSLKHVSSGDLLRGAVAARTPAGIEAETYMKAGKLVPDSIIAKMIADVASQTSADSTILLDGFPRNEAQAAILDETAKSCGASITAALMLDVPDEILFDRIAGRRTCPKCSAGYHVKNFPPKVEGICDKCGTALTIRKDDNPETVKNRLEVYHSQTEPVIAWYEKAGVLKRINATGDLDKIVAEAEKALKSK
jgi:adenylate kinase